MGRPSEQLRAFMDAYKIEVTEVWEVRSGGAWAIKHNALERVAAEQKIMFDPPTMIETNSAQKIVSMCVTGRMGDRTEWSIGEAAPSNYRTTEKMSAYPYAMAEKRGKDRVILKLLQAHQSAGGTIYSDEESDDFKQKRQNPHVTRPEDIAEPTEYDEQGHPIDNIPLGEPDIETLPKAKARDDFAACQKEIRSSVTEAQLVRWGAANANRVGTFPVEWQEMIRGIYAAHRDDLRASVMAAQ